MLVLTLCSVAYNDVSAQQSQLLQQIQEPDCALPEDCEMKSPEISAVNINGNKPIITGTYDTVFSKYLRIIFGGKTYTLGMDEQLSAAGSEWELNLSDLTQPLGPGAYEIIVATEGYDGRVERVSSIIIITRLESVGTPEPGSPIPGSGVSDEPLSDDLADTPKPMDPGEARKKVSLVPLVATLISSIVFFGLIAAIAQRKYED